MDPMEDPRAVLGVGPDATDAELRRARRRLAKELHPDLHDDGTRAEAERRIAQVNRAFDQLHAAAATAGVAQPGPPPPPEAAAPAAADAFAIDALPVDAFDATLLAAVELGDVIRAEEPYLLAVLLDVPGPAQCLLELAPDAGGTTVTIDLSPRHFGTVPTVQAVRDAFVAEIGRQLGA
jgi:hypothetical protein